MIRTAENPTGECQSINSEGAGAPAATSGTAQATAYMSGPSPCLLVGFTEGLHTIGLSGTDAAADTLAGYYGELMQPVIDRAAGR